MELTKIQNLRITCQTCQLSKVCWAVKNMKLTHRDFGFKSSKNGGDGTISTIYESMAKACIHYDAIREDLSDPLNTCYAHITFNCD